MSRANRRHHKDRMKAKAARVAKQIIATGDWWTPERRAAYIERWKKLADHLAECSCWGCGNQRKVEGPTKQEKDDSWREDAN